MPGFDSITIFVEWGSWGKRWPHGCKLKFPDWQRQGAGLGTLRVVAEHTIGWRRTGIGWGASGGSTPHLLLPWQPSSSQSGPTGMDLKSAPHLGMQTTRKWQEWSPAVPAVPKYLATTLGSARHAFCKGLSHDKPESLCVVFSCSVVSDSFRPHGQHTAHQAPLSIRLSRQEYWSGGHDQGIFPTQGLNQVSCNAGGFFTIWAIIEVSRWLKSE